MTAALSVVRELLRLALLALRGRRTYMTTGCDCPECLNLKRVPWRKRLNQPPFCWDEDDRKVFDADPTSYLALLG